jgi:hypothetical protein
MKGGGVKIPFYAFPEKLVIKYDMMKPIPILKL